MNAVLEPRLTRRPMTPEDLDAVLAVEVRAYSHPWSRGNFADSLAAGYRAEVLEDEQGQLLAYSVTMHGVGELHLLNITVAPERQGQGCGQVLMTSLRQAAERQGLATVWLEVRQSNHRARALYRRLGYQEVGQRRGYYPAAVGREDAVVLRLTLEGADALD